MGNEVTKDFDPKVVWEMKTQTGLKICVGKSFIDFANVWVQIFSNHRSLVTIFYSGS